MFTAGSYSCASNPVMTTAKKLVIVGVIHVIYELTGITYPYEYIGRDYRYNNSMYIRHFSMKGCGVVLWDYHLLICIGYLKFSTQTAVTSLNKNADYIYVVFVVLQDIIADYKGE